MSICYIYAMYMLYQIVTGYHRNGMIKSDDKLEWTHMTVLKLLTYVGS